MGAETGAASRAEAELAVAVAAAILEDIFPKVIANVGLQLEGMKIPAEGGAVLLFLSRLRRKKAVFFGLIAASIRKLNRSRLRGLA